MSSTHEFLREQTANQHNLIEEKLGFITKEPSLETYGKAMMRFAGYYQAFEDEVVKTKALPAAVEFEKRLKTPALIQDLDALKIEHTTIPRPSKLPKIDSKAAALGAMYVLEGSTLGGQILVKMFKEKIAVTPENGAAFYSVYGADTGKMWRSFLAVLNSEVTSDEEKQTALKAAVDTFESLGNWVAEQ